MIGKAIINILLKKKRTVILTTDNPFLLKHAKVGQKIEMDFKLKFVHPACGSAWGRKNQESRFLWWYHWWVSTNGQAEEREVQVELRFPILIFILLVLEKHSNLPIQDGDF